MFDLEVELIFVKGTKVDALELCLGIDPRDLKKCTENRSRKDGKKNNELIIYLNCIF